MHRPDTRPLSRLAQLEPRRDTLERCVFCPKLCRSACPVSNAEPRETLTPWGKMSMAYFVANESVALAPSYAAPAWACTGCLACRESCDHRNEVAGTLFETRSALVESGVAPEAAKRVLDQFDEKKTVLPQFATTERMRPLVSEHGRVAVLVGCMLARKAPEAAADGVEATSRLTGDRVDLVKECCGAPLLHAGDRKRFVEQGERFAHAVRGKERVVVSDAGCAATLRLHLPAHGVHLRVEVEHFAELAVRSLHKLAPITMDGQVRWHDPCQLGRGLGLYDEPRAVLERALGRAPVEFVHRREQAHCSGAGGLLPVTMPEVAKQIGVSRMDEHQSEGGGTIVTACGSSMRAFAREGHTVLDLATVVLRALNAARGK